MSGTRLEFSPSWTLACAIVAAHTIAGAAVISVVPAPAGYALGGAVFALGLAAAWARALLAAGGSARALEVSGGSGVVELRDGRMLTALSGKGHVGRLLVTVPMGRRTLLVSRDMLGVEEFRQLRLWALWGRLPRRPVAAKQLAG